MKRWMAAALLLAALNAHGGPLALPAPPQAGFEQHLGAPLPLQLPFTDEGGRSVRLQRYFGTHPVVLVLGYYHCPNLCGITMEGVAATLAALDLPPDSYRVLGVSIDPGERPELAARRKASLPPLRGGDLHLLTGRADAIAPLAAAAGFHYSYDASLGQFAHPAGFLIATPDGIIARYFPGVRTDRQALGPALAEAAAGRIGTLADRLWLLCAHYDPAVGRYSAAAMDAIRLLCLAMLAGTLWLMRRGRSRR